MKRGKAGRREITPIARNPSGGVGGVADPGSKSSDAYVADSALISPSSDGFRALGVCSLLT
jgi:hypothetical protein